MRAAARLCVTRQAGRNISKREGLRGGFTTIKRSQHASALNKHMKGLHVADLGAEFHLRYFTNDKRVLECIDQYARLCQPSKIHIVTGTQSEKESLQNEMMSTGVLEKLNESLRPNSFLARSDPRDVARVEGRTYICSERESDAGPTNNWRDPESMSKELFDNFKGCMKGRTMYVIPFCMGPPGSELSKYGIEITDSPYVVLSMRIMTRVGSHIWPLIEKHDFVRCVHSVGRPIIDPKKDNVRWPCNPEKTSISHFPESREIFSFGSGYGGNALLGKKCFALRIASTIGKDENWLAEHMLISGITNPLGVKKYIAASFPSACGKTNLAMLQPTLQGWKAECVGDDIAWMRFRNKKLYAINPEAGFFGVAPGTSADSNPNALATISHDTIFTNVALNPETRDVWWEGMSKTAPDRLIDWEGNEWSPKLGKNAAHPNSRFTVSATQCPVIDPNWSDEQGVPISAVLFGGRRASTVPLVYKSHNWNHGVFLGAQITSETTAAAVGSVGALRHDPFAMLPFCGYHMGDYFKHWIEMGQRYHDAELPGIFYVNWFRKGMNGEWLWPGFGDNIRVLKWILEDSNKPQKTMDSPIGIIPNPESGIDLSGLDIKEENMSQLLTVNRGEWMGEMEEISRYFESFGDKMPPELMSEANRVKEKLRESGNEK